MEAQDPDKVVQAAVEQDGFKRFQNWNLSKKTKQKTAQ